MFIVVCILKVFMLKHTETIKMTILLFFLGLIEQVKGPILTVNFMAKSGKYFYWPKSADRQSVNVSDILCKLRNAPYKRSSRHYVVPEYEKVDSLML